MELNGAAAQSCEQEAVSGREFVFALCIEVRFTVLVAMRQTNQLGGHVRKGEESTIVVFWKIEDLNQSGDNEERDASKGRRFLLRYYRVFNLEQCDMRQSVFEKLPKVETQCADRRMRRDRRMHADCARDSARWIESVLQPTD